MTEFEEYLAFHEIDPVRLSIEAKVRYFTVHNAKKGKPIAPSNAEKIKGAVHRLTGVPYTGAFVLMDDDTPPFKKIPGNYHWGEVGGKHAYLHPDPQSHYQRATRTCYSSQYANE